MDSFLGNTRPFFQGLPTSTRGYDGPTLEDQTHAPPTPTPPATPTLPPAHVYHPYQHPAGVTGAVPATSLPGLLPPSRPITPATPSHKPPDHTQAASPYSVPSFLQPHPTKTSSNEARCLSQIEHLRQAAVTASTRPSNLQHDSRTPTRPYSSQPSLIIDPRIPARPYSTQSSVSLDSRTLPRPCTTQTPSSVELRPTRPYSTQPGIKADSRTPARPYSTQSTPTSDLRTYPRPFSPQTVASDLRSQLDNKYPPRNEVRSDLRTFETRSDPRADFRDEPWGQLYRVPEAKTLERLAPSVHIAATSISVNGSKDALYLGNKSEDITSLRRSEDPYIRRSIETLQVNGSRDPLYPNGSHTPYSDTKRESSAERQAGTRPKEDSALDLSVKTLRHTPDLTAPDPDKTFSISPLSGVTIERISQSDSLKCTPSSVSVTSHGKFNEEPSTTHVDLLKVAPGISGTPRATPPCHIPSPYGVNGSPSPLPSSSPLTRACHKLPATKRAGDPPYLENFTKLPRRSHTPPTKPTTPSRYLAEAHLPTHPQDRSLYKDSISEQNRGLHLLAAATLKNEDDIRYGRESVTDRRQPVTDRKDSCNEWRDVSLERRVNRDVSFERKNLSLERRDPSVERRGASLERRDPVLERRDPNLDRRELSIEKWDLNSVVDPKYLHARHSDTFDPYRAWANAPEQSKTNSDKVKYLPGQYPVPTSVPTTLPQQGSRVPPAQPPHPYSSYGRPPDTRLPQTPYSQSAHTVSPAHHPQVSVAHSTHGKIHQPYAQPATSRTSQASASHSSSHSSQSPVITSVTQSYHYPYTSSQAVAAHYHQQQQQRHQQQRSATQYTTFSIPQTTKSAAAVSLPPPHLAPQQAAHQAYMYAQQRNEASHALYPIKRTNQMSPHPSGSPNPSISPHPSASPHPTASPHPSASPHPVAASPRSGVSPHPSQQGRTPQLSPHPAQRLPRSSPAQHPSHNYPGSLPPSPYSGHQTYPPHSTSPSRPPSAVASLPHPSQPQPNHPSKSPAAHTSQPPTTHPSQPHINRPTEPHPVHLSQHVEAHPPQGHHSQALTQHSLSSQNHHPQAHSLQSHHFQAVSPQFHPSQTRPSHSHSSQAHPHQSHPSQAHLPRPVISQANSQSSQPSSYPSQAHPYPSQVPNPSQALSQPSQAPPHASQASTYASQAPTHASQAPTRSSQAPTRSPQAPTHSSHAPTHSSQPSPHVSHIPHHPSHVPSHPSQAPHPSHAPPSTSQASSQANLHSSQSSLHPSQAPTLSSEAAPHPFLAPPHLSQAPSHTSQAPLHSSHAPHPSQVPSHPQVHPHTSQASSHPSQAHSHPSQGHPYLHSYPRVSQAPPQPSPALSHPSYVSHPSQALPHPSQAPPHPSQAPPHPPKVLPHSSHVSSHTSQAPTHPPQAPHTLTHPSHASSHPTQASPHPSQVPPHPSQAPPHPSPAPCHPSQAPSHPSQAPPYAQAPPHPSQSFSHTSQTHPHPSLSHPSQASTQPSQTSPRLSQTHSHPSHHIHPTHPHPSQPYPHPHPSQPYPHPHPSQPYLHPTQAHAHLNRAHAQPSQPQSPRAHLSHPHASQMRLPHQAQLGHPMYPSHQTPIQQTSQPHSSHKHPSHPSQPHPPQGHTQHLHYQPPRSPHPCVKIENVPGSSQYPGYMYPSSYTGTRPDIGPARGQLDLTTQKPELSSANHRIPQDHDLSRIRTKGEQKAFDPRSAESGESCVKLEPWSNCSPSVQGIHQPNRGNLTENLPYCGTKPPVQPLYDSDHQDGPKTATVFEFREDDGNRLEQPQSASKMLEPGKAALAEKLHKKIQHAESLESLITRTENASEPSEVKKEEPSEENEWDLGLSKFMEDLAANPEGVTSKKSKTLGRRYLQKVQIQEAIDNDLIVPPPSDIIEEEDESEPEPPVKFRGKFKSIKDKKVERLILTYASHSDESATEMIPDEDASDFEEELKREIRSKDKKRGHSRKIAKGYISSGSETERKDKKKGIVRGRNKENKPNNKQDSDFSPSSISESESSSSTSSDDSDSEDSELEEVVRPRRKGKRTSDSEEEEKPKRRGRKWDSDSTESEEEIIPRRRTRRGYKSSSEGETYKTSQKNKKRKKKQDSSDSEDISMKIRRIKKKKWESDDDDEYIETRRGKKKCISGRKQQRKSRKEDSEEDSEAGEISRKTRGMKKKFLDSKKNKRRKQATAVSSSSDSDETNERKDKNIFQKEKSSKNRIKKSTEDTSENSDIPAKKKSHSKSNLIIDSDDTDDSKNKDIEVKSTGEKQMDKEEGEEEETTEKKAKTMKDPSEEEEQEEETAELDGGVIETELEPDSVIEKLRKMRCEELNREDVKEMRAWLNEVNSDIKKQVGNLQEMAFRHCWKKPQFGAGDDFLHGWQTDVKKYKELTARFPKKLCQAVKHQVPASPTKGTPKKGRDRESGKDSPLRQQGSSSPAKNTRSKSGIIKTSMAVAEVDRLKVAARPEISSVMQRFFEKVLAETSSDCTKAGLASKKFNLGPFPAFGNQRIPTGLTPTPSVAPSMMASDDSDLDSLASLRTDLPASDSIPVSRRSIASSLLKKFGRKYKDKKLNSMCLNKTRSILEATNKPQLLPTPGMPTTEKDLEEMLPDQLKMATFFRKETVSNHRDSFEVIVTKNGINEFTPILYQSRTRNKTKQIQDAATVKSVFGTDIPPRLIKKAEAKKAKKPVKKAEKKDEVKTLVKDESSPAPVSRASTPGESVLAQGDDDEDSELRSERSESVLGELSVPRAAKRSRRKIRKFRSGFDYIRKKKKVKPDDEATPSRKRLPVRRHVNWPEESRDVASEVRSWVVNKGLGETVLHKAARLQYHDVVVYCAESPDFDINVRDNAGYTPLHEACNRGHLDIAQVLCAHGAHVNAPGYKGMRPLHEAVENGHGELARLLLAYGADPALTTYAGQTCLALSADAQTTNLIEGYLADLKGRPGEMWHFGGPTRFLDPDEQGCDLFGNTPAGEIVPSHERLKSSDETDKQNSESQNEKTSDVITACEDVAQKIKKETLQRKSENLSNCEESTFKINQNPTVQMSEVQDLMKKEEILTENKKNSKESTKVVFEEKYTPTNNERRDSDSFVREENQDLEYEEKWDSKNITFETSELPLLDVFQVDGRPHKYCLMLELLTLLKMTQAEFIISARTIETLELSLEEFESRAHSCILGSCSRAIVDTCSCVVLVRVTHTVEKLLGIETVKL